MLLFFCSVLHCLFSCIFIFSICANPLWGSMKFLKFEVYYSLSLAKKLKIIEAVGKGDKSHRDVAKEFSVAKSTVRLLCCKKGTIRKQLYIIDYSYIHG